jgi:hypothetical protein
MMTEKYKGRRETHKRVRRTEKYDKERREKE